MRLTLWRSSLMMALIVSVTACVNIPYRPPTQQGNVIEPERIGMIHEGLTKQQVADISGTPVMRDIFHKDRWDYIYRLEARAKPVQQKRLTVWFNDGVVTRVEHSDSATK